jgi:diguanylate cyclase (GGDEF)-like protein
MSHKTAKYIAHRRLLQHGYQKRAAGQSLRRALVYLTFGCLWIFGSDKLMTYVASGRQDMVLISNIKGFLFVFATAALFFVLMYSALKRILKSHEDMTRMAFTDELTGLNNRKYIEKILPDIDDPSYLPLSVIVGDFNGLKLVNDAFGYVFGNELLKLSATAIKNVCRSQDIISRWGSDEFLVLLPHTDKRETQELVGRLKNECARFEHGGISADITFGWATKVHASENLLDLIGQAENVMYDYKAVDSKSMRSKTITVIMSTLHEKNPREAAHSKRVGELCRQLSTAAGFPAVDTNMMNMIGHLHDIGKIAIPDEILNKSGALTDDELSLIRQHPEIGYRILQSSYGNSDITEAILCHHERWDGAGYPKGLKDEEIPRIARVIAIADSFDAMTSDRPYRGKMSTEAALKEIKKNAGLQFDPELADIFVKRVVNMPCL